MPSPSPFQGDKLLANDEDATAGDSFDKLENGEL